MKSRDGRTVLRQNYEAMYATEYTKHKNLHLTNEKLMGKTAIEKAGDLIHIILLGLAKNLPPYTEENKLHRLLGALFTNELTADEKISIIESEYNIEAKNELRKDVRKVSGLGESLVESAAEEAWEQREIKFIISMNEKGYTIEQIFMTRITKDTTIGEAIQYDAGIVSILMGAGMHCVGCPSSAGETLEEAAMVHGLDCDELLQDIHDYLQSVG